jgi:starch phosphorylase
VVTIAAPPPAKASSGCRAEACPGLRPTQGSALVHSHSMHLAELKSYLEADHRLCELYADPDAWVRKVILNVGSSGKFSSDRTITEYTGDIWRVEPSPVP